MNTEPLPLSYWVFMFERMEKLSGGLLPLRSRDLDHYRNPGQALADYFAPWDEYDLEAYVDIKEAEELAQRLGVDRLDNFRERVGSLGLDSVKKILDVQWQLRTLPGNQAEIFLRAASTTVSAAELEFIAQFFSKVSQPLKTRETLFSPSFRQGGRK